MPAKLTFYPPHRAARFLVLRDGETLEVGRDASCSLVIEDTHVSKRHARLRWTGADWALEDLGSKNGTTLNGQPCTGTPLQDGDWISFGGLMARFEQLTAAQAATLESAWVARIQTSAELRRRLRADLEPADLLLRLLESAMELTATERGFVLVAGPEGFRAEVAAGFSAEELCHDRFRGSVGALRQALRASAPVVVSNAPADPRLGKRPSVAALGIGSLACMPLLHQGRILGLIYVDSSKVGPAFTEADIQALDMLADHTARILAPSLADRTTGGPAPKSGLVALLQKRIDELLPAV